MPVQQLSPANEPDRVILSLKNTDDQCEVYLHGATVTSWRSNGKERLFMGAHSKVAGPVTLHGGIPLVFPQFGTPDKPPSGKLLPQHGFARSTAFKWLGVVEDKEDEVSGRFQLDESLLAESTKALWPFKFQFIYTVILKAGQLSTYLTIKNTDKETWKFTTLIHTYFSVPDISKATVRGLEGQQYFDKTENNAVKTRDSGPITVSKETDTVHPDVVQQTLTIANDGDEASGGVKIVKDGFKDVVVWNPFKKLGDWDESDHQKMICVEVGNVAQPVTLIAGESFKAGQVLKAL